MSKNIIIKEGNTAKTFTGVSKLSTAIMGDSGRQYWVPEDEALDYVDLATLTVTENGTYTAQGEGCEAFSEIDVDVETEPDLTTKSISQNGTYNASDDNADGYSQITVNVSGGGGGIKDYYYPIETLPDSPYLLINHNPGIYNNKIYAFLNTDSGIKLYSYNGTTWSYESDFVTGKHPQGASLIAYNGQLYVIGASRNSYSNYNEIYKFNGSGFDYVTTFPGIAIGKPVIKNGVIFAFGAQPPSTPALFSFDGITASLVTTCSNGVDVYELWDGDFYGANYGENKLRKFVGNEWQSTNYDAPPNFTGDRNGIALYAHESKLHFLRQSSHYSFNKKWWRMEEINSQSPYLFCVGQEGIYGFRGGNNSGKVSLARYVEV